MNQYPTPQVDGQTRRTRRGDKYAQLQNNEPQREPYAPPISASSPPQPQPLNVHQIHTARKKAWRIGRLELDVATIVLLIAAIAGTAYFIYHMIALIRMKIELNTLYSEMDEFSRQLVGALAGTVVSALLPTSFYIFFGIAVVSGWSAVFVKRPIVSLIPAIAYIIAAIIIPKLAVHMVLLAAFTAVGYFLAAKARNTWI